MPDQVTVYVYLRDEGTEVWRPVQAERVGDDTFRIVGKMDEDERWEFPPGSVVRAEPRAFQGGRHLVAIAP